MFGVGGVTLSHFENPRSKKHIQTAGDLSIASVAFKHETVLLQCYAHGKLKMEVVANLL